MPIEVHCPECQALLRIADENAGRQSRCPSCSTVFTPSDVLASAAEPTPPTLPPTVAPMGPPTGIDAINPYAPSSAQPEVNRQGSSEWAPTQFNVEEVFSTTWAIFKVHWLLACAAVLIVGAANFGMQMIQNVLTQVAAQAGNDVWIVILAQIGLGIGFGLLQMWLQIGQIMVMFDIARGREVSLGKLFAGAPYLLQWVLAWLMVMMIVGAVGAALVGIPAGVVFLVTQDPNAVGITAIIGGLVAAIPVFVLMLMFSQAYLLIVDRGLDAVASLHTSYEITNGNKLNILVIGILLGLIGFGVAIVGLLALCVGIIPAMIGYGGYSSLLFVVMYLIMTGQRVALPQQYTATGPVA
jgi:predicted Zn finger-like uncharacterized protein